MFLELRVGVVLRRSESRVPHKRIFILDLILRDPRSAVLSTERTVDLLVPHRIAVHRA